MKLIIKALKIMIRQRTEEFWSSVTIITLVAFAFIPSANVVLGPPSDPDNTLLLMMGNILANILISISAMVIGFIGYFVTMLPIKLVNTFIKEYKKLKDEHDSRLQMHKPKMRIE